MFPHASYSCRFAPPLQNQFDCIHFNVDPLTLFSVNWKDLMRNITFVFRFLSTRRGSIKYRRRRSTIVLHSVRRRHDSVFSLAELFHFSHNVESFRSCDYQGTIVVISSYHRPSSGRRAELFATNPVHLCSNVIRCRSAAVIVTHTVIVVYTWNIIRNINNKYVYCNNIMHVYWDNSY